MPAKSPIQPDLNISRLAHVGAQLRAERKRLRVNAVTAAEAAGMSRVTLHRIERGEPSVTMGAYLNLIDSLGLKFAVEEPNNAPVQTEAIRLADYPQLKGLAWHIAALETITPNEALSLYERNWRHLDQSQLKPHEQALIDQLIATVGKGHLLV